MTALLDRPAPTPPVRPADKPVRIPPARRTHPASAAARSTVTVGIGAILAALPVRAAFTDWRWFVEAACAVALITMVLAALRMRTRPALWHTGIAFLVLAGYLTAVYMSGHALGGVVPTPSSWNDLLQLRSDAAKSIAHESAPVTSTAPLRFISTLSLAGIAIVIDALAIVAKRPASAGLPILAIFTAAGSIANHTVHPIWFVAAAAAFLIILSSGSLGQLQGWGHTVGATADRPRTASPHSFRTGRLIGVFAVIVALAIPAALPGLSSNLLTKMLRAGGGSTSTEGVRLAPFAKLKGTLDRSDPVNLFTVTLQIAPANPYYLRQLVLDKYTSKNGWTSTDPGTSQPIGLSTTYAQVPPVPTAGTQKYTATIALQNLQDTSLPTFANTTRLTGRELTTDWSWRPSSATVTGTGEVSRYTVGFTQPNPSVDELLRATAGSGPALSQWLTLPTGIPASVKSTTSTIIAGITNPYLRARALSEYFTKSSNGFIYSLDTKQGDTGDALADFLKNKQGFCQQYAGAMAVMARMAGLPARVVLGYTHQAPNDKNQFTVTTQDAHAWVEIYFNTIGWVAFDPTPLIGTQADRAVELPWAPHTESSDLDNPGTLDPDPIDPGEIVNDPTDPTEITATDAVASDVSSAADSNVVRNALAALVLVAVVALLCAPTVARRRSRRARIGSYRDTHEVEPLWAEFLATARDLHISWSPGTTVRQVGSMLAMRDLDDIGKLALTRLCAAVDLARYAPHAHNGVNSMTPTVRRHGRRNGGPTAEDDLKQAVDSLRATTSRSTRFLARIYPASTMAAMLGLVTKRQTTLRTRWAR
jgi:transglutaminase-like putative cysteine protease